MSQTTMIPIDEIHQDTEFNCREAVNMFDVRQLARSIAEHAREPGYVHEDGSVQEEFNQGLLQPVIVRPYTKEPGKKWQLVAGYRRTAAFGFLRESDPRYDSIPATIVKVNDTEAFRLNLTENIQRAELTRKEEAAAVMRLHKLGLVQDDIARELGKSRGWVQERLYLTMLPEDVQDVVVEHNLSGVIVRELYMFKTDEERREAVKGVKERLQRGMKIKSVRQRVRPKDKKLIPKKPEVFEMMERVAKDFSLGWTYATRLMAWCVGEIRDGDMELDLANARRTKIKMDAMIATIKRGMLDGTLMLDDEPLQDHPDFADLYDEAAREEAARQERKRMEAEVLNNGAHVPPAVEQADEPDYAIPGADEDDLG